jgi:DNA-binding response OmpR family regulator
MTFRHEFDKIAARLLLYYRREEESANLSAALEASRVRILVVEDEKYNRKIIEILMRDEGFEVDAVDNPAGALQMIDRTTPQLILLDINFGPKQPDGFVLYQKLREKHPDIPVIFITSRGDLDDKLRGLDMGADDYITKPFAGAEVVARVKRVLHRVYQSQMPSQQQRLRFEGIELNIPELSVLIPSKRPISLTPTELKMMMCLMQHADQVVSRSDLLAAVWGDDYPGESNIVDSYIRKLRRKIEAEPSKPHFLRTVRGFGYKFSVK